MSEMSSLKIISFNANGLGSHEKRKDVFDYLRSGNYDILMLQETHFKSISENFIRSCWGFNCYVSGETTNKGGVAILFNNTFEYCVHNCTKGNGYIILDLEIIGKRLSLMNVYGPSDLDNVTFFDTIFDELKKIGNDDIIIGGDWNVILNPTLDSRGYVSNGNKPRSRRKVLDSMLELDLIDIFRQIHPDKKCYTWRRFNSLQQGRLDYFVISESLLPLINGTNIVSGYRSDHCIVTLLLKKEKSKGRTRSYWKFNNSLLYDTHYVDLIKQCILNVKKQYAVLLYNSDTIDNISNEEIQFVINDQLFLETLLLEIRGKTISFASHKKKMEVTEENELVKNIEILESNSDLDEDSCQLLDEKKSQLELLRNKKLQGMMIRSRFQWIDKGEKPSKYFCNLEKRNFVSKQMTCLEKSNGDVVFDDKDIVNEAKQFYEDLYSRKNVDDISLHDVMYNPVKLNDNEKESIEGHISYQEALSALRNMKKDKSPGSDGFSVEFFKFFFIDIGHFIIRSINYGFMHGKLSITQNKGLLHAYRKKGKIKDLLKTGGLLVY